MVVRSVVLVLCLTVHVAFADRPRDYPNWGTVKGRGHGVVWTTPREPSRIPRYRKAVTLVTLGELTVNGGIEKAVVRRYIERRIELLQHCYERELLANPHLAGTVTATFEVSPDGVIRTAAASGFDKAVAGCVATVTTGIELPKPSSGKPVVVTYPLLFRPL